MPDPRPRRPLGRAIRRTDAERAQAAAITPMDIVNARLLWHETAPPGWAGLIEAKVEPSEEDPLSPP